MDVRHFRYFVAVAEALSFAGAARELKMSQPPLSKRIADLEGELGLKLFDRTSKKVDLTSGGEAFLPQARAAVRAFDAAFACGSLTIAQPITSPADRLSFRNVAWIFAAPEVTFLRVFCIARG